MSLRVITLKSNNMKRQLAIAIILTNTTSAFGASKIECVNSRQNRLAITADQKKAGRFRVNMDPTLSSVYLGGVENRALVQTKSESADIIDDWDGNSGVQIAMRKGFLSAPIGTRSKAFVTVTYDDIAQDKVSNTLSCSVVE